jgi:hypothetical protein
LAAARAALVIWYEEHASFDGLAVVGRCKFTPLSQGPVGVLALKLTHDKLLLSVTFHSDGVG